MVSRLLYFITFQEFRIHLHHSSFHLDRLKQQSDPLRSLSSALEQMSQLVGLLLGHIFD